MFSQTHLLSTGAIYIYISEIIQDMLYLIKPFVNYYFTWHTQPTSLPEIMKCSPLAVQSTRSAFKADALILVGRRSVIALPTGVQA